MLLQYSKASSDSKDEAFEYCNYRKYDSLNCGLEVRIFQNLIEGRWLILASTISNLILIAINYYNCMI
jgi:hypothetical protein